MNYIWVIAGSIFFLILTSFQRWYMRNVSYDVIERSNDPYVYLIGVIIILHFFYFGLKIDNSKKTKNLSKLFENKFLGILIFFGILFLLGIIGSYIIDFTLY